MLATLFPLTVASSKKQCFYYCVPATHTWSKASRRNPEKIIRRLFSLKYCIRNWRIAYKTTRWKRRPQTQRYSHKYSYIYNIHTRRSNKWIRESLDYVLMGKLKTSVLEIELKVVYSTARSGRYIFVNSKIILLNELIQSWNVFMYEKSFLPPNLDRRRDMRAY